MRAAFSSLQLRAGVVVCQNIGIAFALLRHGLCAPLAQAHAVAVTPGGKAEIPALVLHGKAGAAQTQRPAQGRRAGHGLPADRDGFCVSGAGQRCRAEPALQRGEVGRNAKACKDLLHLLCGKGDGVFVVVSGTVGAAVH